MMNHAEFCGTGALKRYTKKLRIAYDENGDASCVAMDLTYCECISFECRI